jgi:hypothetical protein
LFQREKLRVPTTETFSPKSSKKNPKKHPQKTFKAALSSAANTLFSFSDFTLAAAAGGQQFGSLPSAAAAAIAAQAAQQAAVAATSPVAVAGAPGKARSSMSLQLLSGR